MISQALRHPAISSPILKRFAGSLPTLRQALSAPAWIVVLVGVSVWQVTAVALWALLQAGGLKTEIAGIPFALGFAAGAVVAIGYVAVRDFLGAETIVPHVSGLGIYALPVGLGVVLPAVFLDPVTALEVARKVLATAPVLLLLCCAVFALTRLGSGRPEAAKAARRQAISRWTGLAAGASGKPAEVVR